MPRPPIKDASGRSHSQHTSAPVRANPIEALARVPANSNRVPALYYLRTSAASTRACKLHTRVPAFRFLRTSVAGTRAHKLSECACAKLFTHIRCRHARLQTHPACFFPALPGPRKKGSSSAQTPKQPVHTKEGPLRAPDSPHQRVIAATLHLACSVVFAPCSLVCANSKTTLIYKRRSA